MGGGRGKAGASGRNRRAAAGDGRSGDRGGSLELGHEREGEEEEGKSRTAPGDDKEGDVAHPRRSSPAATHGSPRCVLCSPAGKNPVAPDFKKTIS